jgi:hypothetical protein
MKISEPRLSEIKNFVIAYSPNFAGVLKLLFLTHTTHFNLLFTLFSFSPLA